MAIIGVINKETHELDAMIMASMTDECREGFYFVEIPRGYLWDVESKSVIRNPKIMLRVEMEKI
jgi:hypothetical protein